MLINLLGKLDLKAIGKSNTEFPEIPKSVRCPRFFAYVAPGWMDIAKQVANGTIPISKAGLRVVRSKDLVPSKGDKIIVLRERPEKPSIYELVSLCNVLMPPQKPKIPGETKQQTFKYWVEVSEISLGESKQPRNLHLLEAENLTTKPVILPSTEAAYDEAQKHFPLLQLSQQIPKTISKLKLDERNLEGYVFDFGTFQLCQVADFLTRLADNTLEDAIKKRITGQKGYDMIHRLFKEALRVSGADLNRMDWQKFEDICSELVRYHGMQVQETKRTGDGGVDFYARDEKTPFRRGLYVFQVKHKPSVGVEVIRQLDSVIREQNAVKGVILTTGNFTRDAIQASNSLPIELIDGSQLGSLFRNLDKNL